AATRWRWGTSPGSPRRRGCGSKRRIGSPGGLLFTLPGRSTVTAMPGIDRYVTRELLGLDAGTSCREAAKLMAEKRIGAVAVKQGARTLGLVTERDLVYNVLAKGSTCNAPIVE